MHLNLWVVASIMVTGVFAAAPPPAQIWTGCKELPIEQNLEVVFHRGARRNEAPADGVVAFPKLEEHVLGRWRVWLKVPETGDYTFFVAADDTMAMWLSPDDTLAQAKMIAFNRTATDVRQWIRHPSQKSVPVRLEKGVKYAMMLAWCNYGGPGHVALGWQPPGVDGPVAMPLLNPDGSSLFEPYQVPPSDVDNDMLPDEWEREHGLKVDKELADMSGWGDFDNDSASNHEEYQAGTDPCKAESRAGLVTLDGSNEVSQINYFAYRCMPDEIFWLQAESPFKLETRPLDKLGGEPRDRSAVRLRALIKAPVDGYYNFCSTATGRQTAYISDDATPHAVHTRFSQLHYTFGNFDSPSIYLKKDEVRYFELRQVHMGGPRAIGLAWRLPDGTTQGIPKECVRNYVPADNDPDPAMINPDGRYAALLKRISPGEPIVLNLDRAQALTKGWAAFSGHDRKTFLEVDPAPDFSKGGLSTPCGGSLELDFEIPKAGYAVLSAQIQLCIGLLENAGSDCELEIDGVRFGRETLWARDTSAPVFRWVTPWLDAGRHKLRLHFTPQPLLSAVRIFSVGVHPVADGEDTAAVRGWFSKENAFMPERGDGAFLRSPACVEIKSSSTSMPELKANGREVSVRPGSTNMWWADVPLPEDGEGVDLSMKSPACRVEGSATASWAETRVAEHRMLHVRQGDALRLSAWSAGVENDSAARAVLVFRGREIETPHGKPVVCRFDKAGDEKILARFTAGGGPPKVAEMTVRVLPRWREDFEVGVLRSDWTNNHGGPPFAQGVWVDGGEVINAHAKPSGNGETATEWRFTSRRVGRLAGVARAGRNGPILGRIVADGVEAWPQWESFTHKSGDGSDAFYSTASWVITGLPPGWKVRSMFSGSPEWEVYHPNAKEQPEPAIYPWRHGVTAWAQFWFQARAADKGYPSFEVDLLPPDKGSKK